MALENYLEKVKTPTGIGLISGAVSLAIVGLRVAYEAKLIDNVPKEFIQDFFAHSIPSFALTYNGYYAFRKSGADKYTAIAAAVGCSLFIGISLEYIQESSFNFRKGNYEDIASSIAGISSAIPAIYYSKQTKS